MVQATLHTAQTGWLLMQQSNAVCVYIHVLCVSILIFSHFLIFTLFTVFFFFFFYVTHHICWGEPGSLKSILRTHGLISWLSLWYYTFMQNLKALNIWVISLIYYYLPINSFLSNVGLNLTHTCSNNVFFLSLLHLV